METKELRALIGKIAAWRLRLEINRYNLGDECVKQPAFYAEAAKELPKLAKLKKQAKAQFEFVKADLELQIRKDPSGFGLEKATDKAVAAAVIVQDEYQTTQEAYFEAEQLEHDLEVVVDSVSDRKSMIRDLVRLCEHDYFQNQEMQPMGTTKKQDDDQADKLEKFRRNRRRERRNADKGKEDSD